MFQKNYVDQFSFYDDSLSFFKRLVRKITLSINPIRKRFWYGIWFQNLHQYDLIIVFSINSIGKIIEDIDNAKRQDTRILFFFWDPVQNVKECLDYPFSKWSFDRTDCFNYSLKFNTTFYFKDILENFVNSGIKNGSVYFAGLDKGRKEKIKNLEHLFHQMNIKTQFIVLDEKTDRRVSFQENLENISKSDALLDIVQDNQAGMTVRVLESLFFQKKLITDNLNIQSEMIYNSRNIFIIGVDDYSTLPEFLSSSYDVSGREDFMNYYNFSSWLARF